MRSDYDKSNDSKDAQGIAEQIVLFLNDAGLIPEESMTEALQLAESKISDRVLDYGNAIRKETAKSFVECFTEKEREMQ